MQMTYQPPSSEAAWEYYSSIVDTVSQALLAIQQNPSIVYVLKWVVPKSRIALLSLLSCSHPHTILVTLSLSTVQL